MADKVIISKSKLTALADAIRSKSGGTNTLTVDDMVTSINAISGSINNDTVVLIDLIERDINDITIPDSVTSIGSYAFYYCTSLTSITIPDSVTSIENSAFYFCTSLTSITIPDSVTSIGRWAFYGCSSLTSIVIPDSVTSIEEYTFGNCVKLTSITIPGSVTSIEVGAFVGCAQLATIDFSSHTTVPTLYNNSVFNYVGENVEGGCQAILPDALYDEWIATDVWKDVTTLTYKKASEVA